MALSSTDGNFLSPTSAATTTTVAGLSFAPKAVRLWSTGQTADGYAAGVTFGMGFSDGTTSRSMGIAISDAVATTAATRRSETKPLVVGTTPILLANVLTLTSDGFTLTWTTVQASGRTVFWEAYGGSDMTNAKVLEITTTRTTAGTEAYTGMGFKPDAALFLGGNNAGSVGSSVAIAKFVFGAATSQAARWGVGLNAANGQTMTAAVDAMRSQRSDSCLVGLTDTAAIDYLGDLSSWDTDGLTINWTDAPAAGSQKFAVLAFKGGTYLAGVNAKPTGAATVNQDITVGFPVTGLVLSSWNIAASTTITADTKLSIGGSDGTNESSIWETETDATINTVAKQGNITGKALRLSTAASTTDAECDASFVAVANSVRLAWTTNNAVAAEICYLAMGSSIANTIDGNKVSWPDHLNSNVGPFQPYTPVAGQGLTTSTASFMGNTSGTQQVGQTFIPTASGVLKYVNLTLQRQGSPVDSLVVSIYTDVATAPAVLLASVTTLGSTFGISAVTYAFDFTSASLSLTSGVTYWIKLSRTGAIDASNFYSFLNNNNRPYTSGAAYTFDGATWTVQATDEMFSVQIDSGGPLYVVLVDKAANKLRCYKSTDFGVSWSAQDYANSPSSSTTANYKTVQCQLAGAIIYCFKPVSSSSMTIEMFDVSIDSWLPQIAGPTITINTNVSGTCFLQGAYLSNGSYRISYQGATETVSSVVRRRVKSHYRNAAGTWNGPYDVQGSANSPPANTLPATATDYDGRAVMLTSSDRVLCLYTDSAASGDCGRYFLSTDVFGTVGLGINSVISGQSYSHGLGQAYTSTSINRTSVVVLATLGSSLPHQEQMRDADDNPFGVPETQVVAVAGESTNSNPGVFVDTPTGFYDFWIDDASQNINYVPGNRVASGITAPTFGSSALWKAVTCNGISAGTVSGAVNGRIGVVYNEQIAAGFVVPKYDALDLPYSGYGRPNGMSGYRQLMQILTQ